MDGSCAPGYSALLGRHPGYPGVSKEEEKEHFDNSLYPPRSSPSNCAIFFIQGHWAASTDSANLLSLPIGEICLLALTLNRCSEGAIGPFGLLFGPAFMSYNISYVNLNTTS